MMYAQVIRPERYGRPEEAFRLETIPVPECGPDDVLIAVMAAGVNYNNVWAALGRPVDVIAYRRRRGEPEDFHVGGSDAAGIVYRVGENVANVRPGDEVVVCPGVWDREDDWVRGGGDVSLAPSFAAWGYETNWGSFAQFCRVRAWQCLRRPRHLTWAESAVYVLCGATASRMLLHWRPHVVRPGTVVLVWGGAGGLGAMAIQLTRAAGGQAVAVVNSPEKAKFCLELGALGAVDRSRYGVGAPRNDPDGPDDPDATNGEPDASKARAFREAILAITGGQRPEIVLEHPGERTLPLSQFVCAAGGMIVTCAGTTGYRAALSEPDHAVRQLRFQGSHFAGLQDLETLQEYVGRQKVGPALSRIFDFTEVGHVHGLMFENKHSPGNMAIRVGDGAGRKRE